MLGLFASFVSIALLPCAVAAADSVTTDFENFNTCPAPQPVFAACGTVDGQHGWKSAVPGDIPSLPQGYDQQVVLNAQVPGLPAPGTFGGKSLRLSNGYNPGPGTSPPEFHFQTYSTPTTQAAGQDLANTVYTAQFSFISVDPQHEQSGLRVSVSPDMGEGGRMSYIGLDDTADGIDVTFYDTPNPDDPNDFEGTDLGTLPRNQPHTIRFWMKLNPGTNDDLVRILVDGHDFGQCFTTWENFYRGTNQSVPDSDRLLFLSGSRDGNHPSLLGGGYLFDNVSVTTSDSNGPPGCDLPIEKQADSPTVTAGGIAGYRLSVRNRGRLTERNLLLCDHIPKHTTFVSADRKLRRIGRRRCLFIRSIAPGHRASVHLRLRVNANAAPGTLDNVADITPESPPGSPPAPPITSEALPPKATPIPPKPIEKVISAVKVVAKKKVVEPPPPVVTG